MKILFLILVLLFIIFLTVVIFQLCDIVVLMNRTKALETKYMVDVFIASIFEYILLVLIFFLIIKLNILAALLISLLIFPINALAYLVAYLFSSK